MICESGGKTLYSNTSQCHAHRHRHRINMYIILYRLCMCILSLWSHLMRDVHFANLLMREHQLDLRKLELHKKIYQIG